MKKYWVNEWTQIMSNQSYCHEPTVWNIVKNKLNIIKEY